MPRAVGIDLGTTNSVVAVLEGDRPVVIVNAEGGRTTPSVVAVTPDDKRLVGQLARRQAVLNPEGTVTSVKRFMGRKYSEVEAERKIVPYQVVEGKNGSARIRVRGADLTPEEISAQVLRKLVDDASAYLGERVTDAVITVPAYFNDAQRQATKDAGKIAGLNVLRIINEPTAAALAYGADKKKEQTVLVFDLGGGTFDVSILEIGGGVCEVKATSGDTHLGGDDFDKCIVDWIAEGFRKEHGVDLRHDAQALQRLTEAAEKAKCELSSTPQTTISLPFITADRTGPKHLEMKLTRARFEELTDALLQRLVGPVKQALADAGLEPARLGEVLLVGGSTRIPTVQALVRKLTGGKEPSMTVNPDEVVALGAAVQAGILRGEVKDVLLLDVMPLSLGVETLGGVMTKLVERNTTIPTRKSQVFSTAEDRQPAVDIVVLQGEREMARDNRRIGQFKLEGIRPAPRGVPQIEVTFDIDTNGIVNVSARDKDTGKEQRITISGSTSLDRGEIDRMVRDAEAHAAEDRARREAVEARNEADALAYQVERSLQDLNGEIDAGERRRIEGLVAEIRTAVKEDAPADRVRRLKSELEQAARTVTEAAYRKKAAETRAGASAPGDRTGGAAAPGGDGVVDAEFTQR
ncbi:MAG: molecular chaperone DnaK [Planctomycetes bacterium]|nr:molecular chaperone DnaK [Planctomycetota bacterium]